MLHRNPIDRRVERQHITPAFWKISLTTAYDTQNPTARFADLTLSPYGAQIFRPVTTYRSWAEIEKPRATDAIGRAIPTCS